MISRLECVTAGRRSQRCQRLRDENATGLQVGTSPLRMCRSVPQIVVLVILTIASVGAVMSGFARSSNTFLRGPDTRGPSSCQPFAARIVGFDIVSRAIVYHLSGNSADDLDFDLG